MMMIISKDNVCEIENTNFDQFIGVIDRFPFINVGTLVPRRVTLRYEQMFEVTACLAHQILFQFSFELYYEKEFQ